MLQFDKALALKFSPQILKIKMNVLIKLHLYSHTEYKNSDNKICDKALTQNLKKKAFLLNLIIYIENASSEVSCKRPPSPPPSPHSPVFLMLIIRIPDLIKYLLSELLPSCRYVNFSLKHSELVQ